MLWPTQHGYCQSDSHAGEVIQEHRRQTDSKLLLCACPFLECYMENAVKCTLLGKCIHNPFFEKIFHVLYTEKHGQIP